jgi:hypothetical protein
MFVLLRFGVRFAKFVARPSCRRGLPGAGLSHLAEDGVGDLVGPADSLAFEADRLCVGHRATLT